MFEPIERDGVPVDRSEILAQLESLIEPAGSSSLHMVSSLANASALLGWYLDRVNWVGFYLVEPAEAGPGMLVLGPFQGAPACTTIGFGKGVCGTAWQQQRTMVVPDVHAFAGHIACDSASRSEVVVPLTVSGKIVGVLDVDSPEPERFSLGDVEFLEMAAKIVSRIIPLT